MKRIWKVISNFDAEQTEEGAIRLNSDELKSVEDILDEHLFLRYDGKVCHWENGDLMLAILMIDDDGLKEFKRLDNKMHEGFEGWTKYEDITEDVLYDRFDTSIFGFLENDMKFDFFVYRNENLTKDDVLDKILKFGIDSLTKNDKLVLEGKEMILPFDLKDD